METALSKIRHHTGSSLPHQKTPATLLVALESALDEQKAERTPTAYFAGLLTTLEGTLQKNDRNVGEGDVLPAELYLLAFVAPFVPTPVIRTNLETILTLTSPLFPLLSSHAPPLRSQLSLYQSLPAITSNLLTLPRLGNPYLSQSAYSILADLFSAAIQDSSSGVDQKIPDVLTVVISSPPVVSDATLAPAWLSVVGNCMHTFSTLDPAAAAAEVGKVWKRRGRIWRPKNQQLGRQPLNSAAQSSSTSPTAAEILLLPIVAKVGELRTQRGFEYKEAADSTLSTAMRVLGPHRADVDLQQKAETEGRQSEAKVWRSWFPRFGVGWLDIVMPASTFPRQVKCNGNSLTVHSLIQLLLGLDPAFSQLLSQLLYSQPELRPSILRALKVIIDSNVVAAASDKPASADGSIIITAAEARECDIPSRSGRELACSAIQRLWQCRTRCSRNGGRRDQRLDFYRG
ncbi:armadillo-type protein [Salix suchowensis]|nr:armadillo-type protein [Salix suchowensis]